VASLADVIVSDVSEGNAIGNSEAARQALTEAVTEPETSSVDNRTQQGTQEDDGLPTKFKGKSAREIAEAYQNLESRYGSMANDLGVQRQLTDRLLDLKRSNDLASNGGSKQKQAPAPVTTNDILDRPQETLERVVDSRVQSVADEVREENRQLRALVAKQSFESKHKDYQTTVQSSEFIEWLRASPLRMRAAQVANNGDWQVADELFTEYEVSGRNRQSTTTQNQRNDSNVDAARAASFTSSGNASGTDGKAKQGGKIYKRSDLMALRIDDPDAYYDEDFQQKILLAHAEGRVR